jgi:hypothetical protein
MGGLLISCGSWARDMRPLRHTLPMQVAAGLLPARVLEAEQQFGA